MKQIQLLSVLAFALTLCLGVTLARAQNIDPTALANEPALTEADIPIYQAFLKVAATVAADPSKAADIYKLAADSANTTETHAFYVVSKIPSIIMIVTNPSMKDQLLGALQGNMKPTDDEIKLVTDHLAELTPTQ
ncbi:MAG: hypothetical protein LBO66_15295 [Deltaproteobacteria bacterium]|jgi:hypothetical protein|nr:hypothetical protein [Deltaproteobacteria bacterium]